MCGVDKLQGIAGASVEIGITDSGFDYNHPQRAADNPRHTESADSTARLRITRGFQTGRYKILLRALKISGRRRIYEAWLSSVSVDGIVIPLMGRWYMYVVAILVCNPFTTRWR